MDLFGFFLKKSWVQVKIGLVWVMNWGRAVVIIAMWTEKKNACIT